MKINGKPATSGTVVISNGQQARLSLPFGEFDLMFNPAATTPGVSISSSPGRINIDGPNNPLGSIATFSLKLQNGGDAHLTLAIYVIESGQDVSRIVHYTTF